MYESFFLCVGLSIGVFGVGRYARVLASFAIVAAVFLSKVLSCQACSAAFLGVVSILIGSWLV